MERSPKKYTHTHTHTHTYTCVHALMKNESRLVMSNSLWPHGLYSSWNSPGQNSGVGSLSLLQESNQCLLHCRWTLYQWSYQGSPICICMYMYIHTHTHTHIYIAACVLSFFSCVRLFVTLWIIASQAPLSMGFSRQEYWNRFPFPSPGELPKPGIQPRSPTLQ